MAGTCRTLALALWLLVSQCAVAIESAEPDPLFDDDTILDIRLVAPLTTILSERPFNEELPARFLFTNSAGKAVELDVKVRTRGRSRRQKEICAFPPLRLNFRTSQTRGTLFQKQNKMKLVTHCRKGSRYEQVLLREYLAYRIFNQLSDASFRVRLLRIEYEDNENGHHNGEHYGFVIEHRDRLANRLGRQVMGVERVRVTSLDAAYTNLTSMFHYLLGNTDFSPILGAIDESCCHNSIPLGGGDSKWLSVPYDFDQAGLVDAPHAGPNPGFRLASVRQRLYRGRCAFIDEIPATIERFLEKRDAIFTLIDSAPALNKRTRHALASYVEGFYKTIRSQRQVESRIVKACI